MSGSLRWTRYLVYVVLVLPGCRCSNVNVSAESSSEVAVQELTGEEKKRIEQAVEAVRGESTTLENALSTVADWARDSSLAAQIDRESNTKEVCESAARLSEALVAMDASPSMPGDISEDVVMMRAKADSLLRISRDGLC